MPSRIKRINWKCHFYTAHTCVWWSNQTKTVQLTRLRYLMTFSTSKVPPGQASGVWLRPNELGLFGWHWVFSSYTGKVLQLGQVVVGDGLPVFILCVCVCVCGWVWVGGEGTLGDYIMSRLTAICIRARVCKPRVRGQSVTEESLCHHRQSWMLVSGIGKVLARSQTCMSNVNVDWYRRTVARFKEKPLSGGTPAALV